MKQSLLPIFVVLGMLIADAASAACTLPAGAEAGRSAVAQCKACHSFEADRPSRLTGPNLHEAYGSMAGGRADFDRYSEAMMAARSKGVEWTDDALFEYLGSPKGFLDRINERPLKYSMLFQVSDVQSRKDIIAFLKAIRGRPECD